MGRQKAGARRIGQTNMRYRHDLGQHFLYDEGLLGRLAELSGVGPNDDVLEIGPGSGSLTKELCRRARFVKAVELDDRLIPLLEAYSGDEKNLKIVHGDAMTVDLNALTEDLNKPFKIVANIPYYITTPLITRFLASGLEIKTMALMVQKEVAEKLTASPGDSSWGMLGLRAQYAAEIETAAEVPAACFTPPPKVDSAFVVLKMRGEPLVRPRNEAMFFKTASAGFALRRKTMVNALCAAFGMERERALDAVLRAGLDERIRGERLSIGELARLSDILGDFEEAQK